jgi:putative transposase
VVKPAQKRDVIRYTLEHYKISIRRACKLVSISRSVHGYHPKAKHDDQIIDVLSQLSGEYPRFGFPKLFQLMRRQGHPWNHKRVARIYKSMKLNLRRKGKRRIPTRHPLPLQVSIKPCMCWSIDFMSDSLWDGRKFRVFNIIDDYNRQALWIEASLSLPAVRIIRVLDQVIEIYGKPDKLRMDNGPEFVSLAFSEWCKEKGIQMEYIKPGKPMQNGFIERFNGTFRNEILDLYVFDNIDQVMDISWNWLKIYNEIRPHEGLDNLTPIEYLNKNHQRLEEIII